MSYYQAPAPAPAYAPIPQQQAPMQYYSPQDMTYAVPQQQGYDNFYVQPQQQYSSYAQQPQFQQQNIQIKSLHQSNFINKNINGKKKRIFIIFKIRMI